MKTLKNLFVVLLVLFSLVRNVDAQTTRKERKAKKLAAIAKMINDTNYVFSASYANPTRSGQKILSFGYDFTVSKDTVKAYLPYFGQAYLAPNDPSTNEGGIKFTSTKFSYNKKPWKNGGWDITIKPRDGNMGSWRDVQSVTLSISADGYANLQVISSNRDFINFDGEIVAKSAQ